MSHPPTAARRTANRTLGRLAIDRRRLLKTLGVTALAGAIPSTAGVVRAESDPDVLDTLWNHRYEDALPIPSVRSPETTVQGWPKHTVPLTEFTQTLHGELEPTPLWGYDGRYPGRTIEARKNQQLLVEFDNSALPDSHLLGPVDEDVHGTKPEDYPNYEGSVPEVRTVTHVHGLHVESASDGLPEAWTAPDGTNGPRFVKSVFEYPNRQPAATVWYHDHALGITRLNVYAGLAGFYLLRDEAEDALNLPGGDYEVPILLQDRSFEAASEDDAYGTVNRLQYPTDFAAEFAGDVSVVNGKVWPYLDVEPRRYRFRFLNGSNGRVFNLRLANEGDGDVPLMYQIGADLGFLPDVVTVGPGTGPVPDLHVDSLLLAPAERADVVVDFSGFEDQTFTLTNDANFPYTGVDDGPDVPEMGELVQFRVTKPLSDADASADPATLVLPGVPPFNAQSARKTRRMTLNSRPVNGLDTHLLGVGADSNGNLWNDPDAVVRPQLGSTEIWEFRNNTPDSHPIHLHLVEFQVLGRGPDGTAPPAPNERGDKDTVRVDPGEIVRIVSRFGEFTGRYVWHCHILEHEDQEMMLPYEVVRGSPQGPK